MSGFSAFPRRFSAHQNCDRHTINGICLVESGNSDLNVRSPFEIISNDLSSIRFRPFFTEGNESGAGETRFEERHREVSFSISRVSSSGFGEQYAAHASWQARTQRRHFVSSLEQRCQLLTGQFSKSPEIRLAGKLTNANKAQPGIAPRLFSRTSQANKSDDLAEQVVLDHSVVSSCSVNPASAASCIKRLFSQSSSFNS